MLNHYYYFSCLTIFSSFLSHLTSLGSNCLGLLFGTQGRPRRLKPFSTNKKQGTQRDFCILEGTAGPFSVLIFPCGSAGKESDCNPSDLGSIPGLGRFPGEGKGYQLQYSGLENSVDSIAHCITKNQTRLRDFHFSWILLSPEAHRSGTRKDIIF